MQLFELNMLFTTSLLFIIKDFPKVSSLRRERISLNHIVNKLNASRDLELNWFYGNISSRLDNKHESHDLHNSEITNAHALSLKEMFVTSGASDQTNFLGNSQTFASAPPSKVGIRHIVYRLLGRLKRRQKRKVARRNIECDRICEHCRHRAPLRIHALCPEQCMSGNHGPEFLRCRQIVSSK